MDYTLGLRIAPEGADPMYRQLFDQIAERIRTGAFPDGYRLPPSRTLAGALGTHRNTVVRAYAELEEAGFLVSTVGRGTFVRAPRIMVDRPNAAPARRGMPWASLVSEAARGEPMKRFLRMAKLSPAPDAIQLSRMQPAPELIPHELFRRCMDHVLRTHGAKSMGYAAKEGVRPLREQVVEDLARLGVPAAVDDVLITTGSQQGLDLIARVLLNPGDVVVTHASTYAGALQVFSAVGARMLGVPSDDEGPDLEALRRATSRRPKLLYLMPNHCNPTGACISAARREAILQWARDAQVPVIEDDYAADLVLEDAPTPPAMRALDADVLHVGTFSKRLIPSLRVGYLLAPPAMRPYLLALKHTTDLGNSGFTQLALAEFLERGYLRAHLQKIQPAYRTRRDALLDALDRHAPSDLRWTRPTRGVTLWLELSSSVDPDALLDEAMARRVVFAPGTHHAADDAVRPGIRINFCYESEDRLREGAKRVCEAIEAARRRTNRAAVSNAVEMV